jgi:hypothetical protein
MISVWSAEKKIDMNKREIVAGYLWQGRWTGPGFPIYPTYWGEEYKEEMEKSPAEEILDIKPGTWLLEVNYPLSKVYRKEFEVPEKGITRQELMDLAAKAYHKVYYFVNMGIYADGIDEYSKVWNKYGIWGHGIEDLTIHTFDVDDESNTIALGVDS